MDDRTFCVSFCKKPPKVVGVCVCAVMGGVGGNL